jgi:hypothetical protein
MIDNMKKTTTIDLKGKAYATVPARIKEFREAYPNGLIETTPTFQLEGQVFFTARILKDKANPSSGEATGHAIGKMTGDKVFEKLETIAIGRALAILGYMASGEIASSEEMEEFNSYKLDQKKNALELLVSCGTKEELKEVFMALGGLMADKDIINKKDELKKILK